MEIFLLVFNFLYQYSDDTLEKTLLALLYLSIVVFVGIFYWYILIDAIIQKEGAGWIIILVLFGFGGALVYYFIKIRPRRKYSEKYIIKCQQCKKRNIINQNERDVGIFICEYCNAQNTFKPGKSLRRKNLTDEDYEEESAEELNTTN